MAGLIANVMNTSPTTANMPAVGQVAQAGVPLPEGFTWRAADNSDHAFDVSDLVGLAAAMIAHGYAQHLKARALKAAIDAAQTAEAVAAVVWEG